MAPFSLKDRNHLVTPLDLSSLDPTELKQTWDTCTQLKQALAAKGSRFDNLTWRLWHMQRTNQDAGWREDKGKGRELDESAVQTLLGMQSRPVSRQQQGEVMDWSQLSSAPDIVAPQPRHAFPQPQHNLPLDWTQPAHATSSAPFGTLFMDHLQQQVQSPNSFSSFLPPQPRPPNPPTNNTLSNLLTNPPLSSFSEPAQLPPTFPSDDAFSALFNNGGGALPLFHSSYGAYQPVTGPLARFLTPSPGPSLLGNFEDIEAGLNDFRQQDAAGDVDPRSFENIWQDFNRTNGGGEGGGGGGGGDDQTRDPFAGMAVGGRGDGEGGEETRRGEFEMDLEGLARRMEGGRRGDGGGRAEYEQSTRADLPHLPPTLPRGLGGPSDGYAGRSSFPDFSNGNGGGNKDTTYDLPQHFLDGNTNTSYASTPFGGRPSSSESSPAPAKDPDWVPGAPTTGDATDKARKAPRKSAGNATAPTSSAAAGPSKKNRNPHATQLPGSGARKLPKVEASEGHEGPSCSHCQSIATPLWRRGPDDELLCNACGLYQKLHSKPRPKQFGKAGSKSRSSSGAAAQAAASATPPSCFNCSATSTPMWRKDPDGNLCCNACSLYYKLHNVVRPIALSRKRAAKAAASAAKPSATPSGRAGPSHDPAAPPPPTDSPPRPNNLSLPPLDRPPVLPPMLPQEQAPPGYNQRWTRSPVSVERDRDLPPPKRVRMDESWERGDGGGGGGISRLPLPPPPSSFASAGAYHPTASAMGSTAAAYVGFSTHPHSDARHAPGS